MNITAAVIALRCSEGGHAGGHGGGHEGRRGPRAPDALHLWRGRAPLHPREGDHDHWPLELLHFYIDTLIFKNSEKGLII